MNLILINIIIISLQHLTRTMQFFNDQTYTWTLRPAIFKFKSNILCAYINT